MICPVCDAPALPFRRIDGVQYMECGACGLLFADPGLLREIDAGRPIRAYDAAYWLEELPAARERSFGPSLARVAEAILYSSIPIRKFVDIGTGPGYLLDALSLYLPASRDRFFGVEAFPPPNPTRQENYVVGRLRDTPHIFDGGVCIEVVEHLTPAMLDGLAREIAAKSAPGALYLINTGLDSYVRNEDPAYLDPLRRGHIISYSLPALKIIFDRHAFAVRPIAGKSWAFAIEYQPKSEVDLSQRIWATLPENRALLTDPEMGSVLYLLGLESARAYP